MMPLVVSFAGVDPTSALLWLVCWFLTIGLHEGGHGWMAYWRGDDTAYLLGKRSINPLRHIDWHRRESLIPTVILPVVTVFLMGWPIGMASVPVNPYRLYHPVRDRALVGAAGPMGNLIGTVFGAALLALAVYLVLRTHGNVTLHPFHFSKEGTSVGLALLAHLAYRMMLLNILLAVINLLPIPGVDGGDVLYAFLTPAGRETFDRVRPYGMMIFVLVAWFLLGEQIARVFGYFAFDVTGWIIRLVGGG